MELATDVYRLTESFPSHERYGLSQQLRRAAISIASNIAEGAARQTKKEFIQFLYIALGSSVELETQFELAKMLGYCDDSKLESVYDKQIRISKMLLGLIRSLKRSKI